MNKIRTKLETRWDKRVVPAEEPRKRGLLIELTGVGKEETIERRGINLALAIDRSGSMGTVNMEAAKMAAIGVVENLTDMDVLSVVDFDTEITALVRGRAMTPEGKSEAIAAISTLRARGGTALGAGWFEAARCVSSPVDAKDFKTGHIVLLSDGHANSGVVDPIELAKHAAELAERGVTTSTVGIGPGYSPLQLEALAEGGRGRLHDAEGGAEIAEVIMGELGETRSILATDVHMTLRWPNMLRAELLANFDVTRTGNGMVIRLGDLVSGSARIVPVLVDVPALPAGEVLDVEVVVEGRCPKDNTSLERMVTKATLTVLPPEDAAMVERDVNVAEHVSRLWESTAMLDAMRMNERGDFAGAANRVREVSADLIPFAAGTAAEASVVNNLQNTEYKVGRSWDGRSKRMAMVSAKKFSKGERDHRSGQRGDWSDHL